MRKAEDSAGPPHYEVGEVIGDRYRIYRHAQGGLGDVYFCLDVEDNLPLALKTPRPRPQMSETRRQRILMRFEDEVRVWAALGNHPNIVRCYYLTRVGDVPFACLEWVAEAGRSSASLGNFIFHNAPLPMRQALDFAIDICRGLLHAAARHPGFVHRDLKPDNVLITQQRVAKVTDFGFSQLDPASLEGAMSERARSDTIVGTPRYMAPEQWRHGRVDSRADVYALGSILFECLTKDHLFDFNTRDEWKRAHQTLPPPHLPDALPAWIDEVIQRCLAKGRDDRFGGVDALLDALAKGYEREFGEPPAPVADGDALNVEDYNNFGNTYAHLQDFDHALAQYDLALDLDPDFGPSLYGRGIALAGRGEHEEAIREYTRSLKLAPENAAALYNRANSFAALGRERFAIADYNAALALQPSLVEAVHNRALVHIQARRMTQAFEDLALAIEMAELPDAYRTRATLLLEMGRETEALADVTTAIERDAPGKPADRFIRARLHARAGDHRRAIIDFNAVIDGDFELGTAFYERGCSYAAIGEHEAALRDLTLARRHDADSVLPLRRRAALLRDLERWDQAMADYLEISEREPDDADVLYEVGLLCGIRGDFEGAIHYLTLASNRGHLSARSALRRLETPTARAREAGR